VKKLLLAVALFAAVSGAAQELTPLDRTPLYRRSFTARYELIGGGPVREAALSPDKKLVGFVREGDLYVKELATGVETRITGDGDRGRIINGATDWVYEEEYAFTRAWEFSPDSRRIAWLRFDESLVPEFSMMRYDGKLYPEPYTFKYPKAGEVNSTVTLHVRDLESGATRQIDTGTEKDQYIPRIGWTPPGSRSTDGELFFYRVNRLQNHFEVVLAGADGATRVIYDETSPSYVERPDDRTVTFLDDGDRFIVRQETRTGWMHLYLHTISKGFSNAVTSGEWEVTGIEEIADGRVRYVSTEMGSMIRSRWSVRLDGSDKRPEEPHPAVGVTVDRGAGVPPVEMAPNDREYFSFVNSDGVRIVGWLMRPANFDPEKRYPLLMSQYSGPGSVSVSYLPVGRGDMAMFEPLLEAGYMVACVDPRGTGGRGEAFKKSTYGRLGKLETEDQIAAARHLASRPYVDPARIGIYGWSYGGFVALNSILKGADVFSLAVAVAPVTSWRFYDTIYTEIYNGLPQDNPKGYDENSPVNYAELLRGKLLLIHGTGDDNVHVQNSFEMAKALVKAGKSFDMMIYPDDNHSMVPTGRTHVREKIVSWVIENL
jgi:dipeptidyl-peptidase-4